MSARAYRLFREWRTDAVVVFLGGCLFFAMGAILNTMSLRAEEQLLFEWSANGVIDDCRVVGQGRIRLSVSGSCVISSAIRLDPSVLRPGRSFMKPPYGRKCLIDGIEYRLY